MRGILALIISAAIFAGGFTAGPAQAAQYSLKEVTPAVEQALNNRKARFSELEALKAQGIIGENNKGYVEVLGDSPAAADIAAKENADRRVIYQAIADQNGISNQIATIEQVFGQVQAEKAEAGYKVQKADGSWGTK